MKEENKQGRDNRIWRNNRRRIDEAVSLEANKIEDNIRKRRREWELRRQISDTKVGLIIRKWKKEGTSTRNITGH